MKKKIAKNIGRALDNISGTLDLSTTPSFTTPPLSSSSTILRHSNLYNTLADMDDVLSSTVNKSHGPGAGGTVEQRLEHILAVLMETKNICEQHRKDIAVLQDKIISLEREYKEVKRELRVVKESTNKSELASRYLTVRVLGLPVSADECAAASPEDRNKAAVKAAYDKIFKPILTVAKAKGFLEVVPQLKTAIEEGFGINSTAKDKRGVPYPPPLIIRFTQKSFRAAVFFHKKEALASLSGGASSDGINCFIVEDLTSATLKKMKELRDDDRVEKVWTTEGQIRFTLVDAPSRVHKFRGVYAPLSEFIK